MPNGDTATVRAWFVSHKNRTDFAAATADAPINSSHSIPIITVQRETGFWSGEDVYITNAPGSALCSVKLNYPNAGEVDLLIALETDIDLDREMVRSALSPLIQPFTTLLGQALGEIFVPAMDPVCYDHLGEKFEAIGTASPLQVKIASRQDLQANHIVSSMHGIIANLAGRSREEVELLDIASRRISSGRRELNIIDKYSDLWEACEFLSHEKGKEPPQRISTILEPVTGVSSRLLRKYIVLPIYRIRCDLVHNAVEKPALCRFALPILDEIAFLLLATKLGFPVMPSQTFTTVVNDAIAAEKSFITF